MSCSIWSGGGSRQRRGRSLSKALRESLRDQLPFDMLSVKRAWEGSSVRSLDKGIRSITGSGEFNLGSVGSGRSLQYWELTVSTYCNLVSRTVTDWCGV
ncbi:hypothetical protein YC2023_019070 [Brassica napus]